MSHNFSYNNITRVCTSFTFHRRKLTIGMYCLLIEKYLNTRYSQADFLYDFNQLLIVVIHKVSEYSYSSPRVLRQTTMVIQYDENL